MYICKQGKNLCMYLSHSVSKVPGYVIKNVLSSHLDLLVIACVLSLIRCVFCPEELSSVQGS